MPSNSQKITISHGSGGKLTYNLIKDIFLKHFKNEYLEPLADAAILSLSGKIAFSTDSYTVKPLFFPGGDIGKLSVFGTINDLAVMGAEPLFISASFVIEEGFLFSDLEKIVESMSEAAINCGVQIVCGDTKVVEKGSADGVFITTTGLGIVAPEYKRWERKIKPGDKIIISGSIGDHEIALLIARAELKFYPKTVITSDCAPLHRLIKKVLIASDKIKFMRDPTRGGLGTVLNELIINQQFGILLEEEKIPVKEEIKAICEILGYDPIYLANEGKVVIVVSEEDAEKVVCVLKSDPLGKDAQIIGTVSDEASLTGKVGMLTISGGIRIIDMRVGQELPRIC